MINTNLIKKAPHYNQYSVECKEVIRHLNYNLGCVIKYIWRAGDKKGSTYESDSLKIIQYLKDTIANKNFMLKIQSPKIRKHISVLLYQVIDEMQVDKINRLLFIIEFIEGGEANYDLLKKCITHVQHELKNVK